MKKKKVLNKIVLTAVLAVLLFTAFTAVASATDIYVGPGETYTTIQAAVTAATAGDTIIVRNGTYHENVDVDKRLTIRSENGSTNCIVNASDSNNHVFDVQSDYVNISGFTINGATDVTMAGICLYNAEHCNISDNNVTNNNHGIYLKSSSNNNLTGNNASNNKYGFYSDEDSHNNTVEDLTISSYPTTVSFTYDNGIKIKGVTTPESDPAGMKNISKYVNATNVSVDSWLFLNVSYSDMDISSIVEDSSVLYR
ncbi:hypothetical protein C5S30_03690 [ANME-1 cluster archaeon GoMg4]|nr:hypothetical protein [ANME-1 cluster archaeon GoMg4]